MENFTTRTIREIAIESPATTRVFEEYKIDYCCHGNTTFNDACRDAGVSPVEISKKIADVLSREETSTAADPSLELLIAHILRTHHVYTKQELEQLTPLMAKVVTRHGEHHPELLELQTIFKEICDDLGPHMVKEETVLFPYIIQLEASLAMHIAGPRPHFGTVLNPVRMMSIEHETVGGLLLRMRDVSNQYQTPEGACPSFAALYARLADLERDLHQHIHLENNMLFPRAIAMEERVLMQL